jgi:hypothetical protein
MSPKVQPFPISLLYERYSYDPLRGVLISKFLGRPLSCKNRANSTYVAVGYGVGDSRTYYTTYGRLVMAWLLGFWPTDDVDHIDRDTSNNRAWNLRIVTRRVNTQNRGTFKGGATKDRNRWKARIRIDGKQMHLGMFDTKEEAVRAYLAALEQL